MKKRMIWLAAFIVTMLLTVSAFAVPLPPQTAGEIPLPSYAVPVVSNVQISGDTVTMDVSGTYDQGGVIIYVTTPSGESQMYVTFTVTASGLSGTITGLPADTISWRLDSIDVYNNSTPDFSMYFYFDAAGALDAYSIHSLSLPVVYNFNNMGHLTAYIESSLYAYYKDDGSLSQYSIITPTHEQIYNGQNELMYEKIDDTAAGIITETSYKDGKVTNERIHDNATGITTETRYENGVLMARIVTDADFSQYSYDGQGVLRRSMVPGAGGAFTINLYDANGNLYSYGTQSGPDFKQYDAEGNLVRTGHYEGAASVIETYRNGLPVQKMVSGQLPDGRSYYDIYENGVYTQRTIYEDDGAYHYDADGNYTGKTTFEGGPFFEFGPGGPMPPYQEFNAKGEMTEYEVYSEQQGGVYLTYNHRRVLQSVIYIDPYQLDIYRYDAKEKIWYLNEVPFDGPVPVILSQLTLEKEIVWYPNNTVCTFGPQFRDLKPDLTDLWYMFTPVDLSHDGTQTYELVGGSVYVLGQVSVTVSGDSVTVNYSTIKGKYGNIYMKSEYLNFFPDLASVKTVVPEELGDGYRFGQTISIAKDLGGDTNVLMFVRNVATFCNFVDKDTQLRRFYKNLPGRVQLRDAMLAMMD